MGQRGHKLARGGTCRLTHAFVRAVLSSVLLLFKRGVLIAGQIVFMTLSNNEQTPLFIYCEALNYLQNELKQWSQDGQ